MSTRANIVRKNEDESFDLIYTHWDGYPEHHAPILLEHYNTDAKIAELLALGDLSILDAYIGTKHNFDNPPHSECTAYGRDRGEPNTQVKHYADAGQLKVMLDEAWTEWVYMWDVKSQQWLYTNNPSPAWFKCCGTEQEPLRKLSEWKAEVSA